MTMKYNMRLNIARTASEKEWLRGLLHVEGATRAPEMERG